MKSDCRRQTLPDESLLDKYSSSIERVNIPLPNFKFYHRASDEFEVDDSFVGRKNNIMILSNWLRDEKTATGAYLVTGYRGMGKSSFVGKVLNEVTRHIGKQWYYSYVFILGLLIDSSFVLFGFCESEIYGNPYQNRLYWWIWGGGNLLVLCILGIWKWRERRKFGSEKSCQKKIGFTAIKVNLGHEILNERELLSLVAKNVLHKYEKKYKKSGWCFVQNYLILLVALMLSFGVYNVLEEMFSAGKWNWLGNYFTNINELYVKIPLCFFLFLAVWKGVIYGYIRLSKRRVISRLIYLNERIESVVSEDDNPVNMGSSYLSIHFNAVRRKSYPQASVREIEQELIDILDEIARKKYFKCKLVFIFDELDKLDPDVRQEEKEEKDRLPEFEFSNSGFSGGAASRVRKQNVLNFLSKLKFFLTTAKCKFIFISGRELYDAYLADVSDREFAVSSIFNGVLYVNSFLSEEGHRNIKDVSTLTENYICKKLLHGIGVKENGKRVDSDSYTLSHYYRHMKEIYKKNSRNEYELQKAMLLLYQFSLYLSHVCNGSPKKITIYFEKYVRNKEFMTGRKRYMTIYNGEKETEYYLSFSYKSQVRIGFVHYMAYPVIQAIINRRSEFGDKLLISASFIVNHIYKHHNSGFSWRNMEYIPELMEVNKTPELRDFIGYIIDFLSQSHIRSTVSGLYRYKFPMKIIEEISWNSKYSEEISAIFNFTLDESLSVKKHYDRLLQHYVQNYKGRERTEDTQVIASIHHILGDLYMADEDYSQAILEFKTCGQIIENRIQRITEKKEQIPVQLMLFYVRNSLKLGCVYEKRNTWDPAFVLYSHLIEQLVKYKEDSDDYFEQHADEGEAKPYREIVALDAQRSRVNSTLSLFDDIQLTYLPSLMKLAILEKMEPTGITLRNIEDMESEFKLLNRCVNEKDRYIIAVDFFRKVGEILYYKNGYLGDPTDSLQMLYLSGVEADQEWTEQERQVLRKINNWEQATAEERKILLILREEKSLWFRVGSCRKQYERITGKGRCLPCYACKYYSRSMSYIIKHLLPKEQEGDSSYMVMTRSLNVMKHLLSKDFSNQLRMKREDFLYITASTMDGFAGVMLSCTDGGVKIRPAFADYFFNVLENEELGDPQRDLIEKLKAEGESTEITPIERAMIYYWDAAEFYRYAGHRTEAAECTKKILRMFFTYLKINKKDNKLRKVILKSAHIIRTKLIKEAIISLYSRYEYMNMPEMQKIRDIFSIGLTEPIELNELTIFPDIEEFCYLYYALLVVCGDRSAMKNIYRSRFMSKYRVNNTFYERIRNLQYKAFFNRYIFTYLLFGDQEMDFYNQHIHVDFCKALSVYLSSAQSIKELLGEYASCFDEEDLEKRGKLEFLEFLVYDSRLCLSRVTDYTATNSDSTLFTNAYIGDMYQRLYEWNQAFHLLYVLYDLNDLETDEEKEEAINKYVTTLVRRHRGGEYWQEDLKRAVARCVNDIGEYTGGRRKMRAGLQENVLSRLSKAELNMLEPAYQAEIAIKFYTRSIEMHSEGRAYKSMIRGMHVLDDDLNNDTCQFDFALERYMINSDYISENIRQLKDLFKDSRVYMIDAYEKEYNC